MYILISIMRLAHENRKKKYLARQSIQLVSSRELSRKNREKCAPSDFRISSQPRSQDPLLLLLSKFKMAENKQLACFIHYLIRCEGTRPFNPPLIVSVF